MVSKQERQEILQKLVKTLKENIVVSDLDLRYLEREKIKGKALADIERSITSTKQLKQAIEEKLRTAEDEIKDLQL